MTTKKIATADELTRLETPDAQAALAILHQQGWLTADAPTVKAFFKDDPDHPASAVLLKEAEFGGLAGILQAILIFVFALGALIQVSVAHKMSLSVFVLWGALGVTTALLVRQHPGFRKLLGGKKATTA
ncbi:hypothetical protein G3A43_07225 [Paraburkholderia aspalathi]|nr:hypothetical protein [Paraburkholderia aspalathi]MBK3780044.1 hypothetical protein [Paraburkholderia aspalathi]